MSDPTPGTLGPGDRAPAFDLPAADVEGRVTLSEHLRKGPVLLTILRGLYCPFCRRQISQLRPTCERLRSTGIELLGIVVASPERSRQYFRHFPPCFPIGAAPDRAIHRAFGLREVPRTSEFRQETERKAAAILREEFDQQVPAGKAMSVFMTAGGFEITVEDKAELERPLQSVAYFLIGSDGLIRWVLADPTIVPLPNVEELLLLV
jgi:peroxiredoxin